MKQLSNRLKRMVELENNKQPVRPVDCAQIILSFVNVFGGYA